ncbi:MAG: dockerin type I domain-containing protein, partial [Pirellula sp.]
NDLKHWSAGLSTDGRLAAMAPDSPAGLRRLPTRLDYAAMQDIGWQLLPTYAQVNATHIYGDNGVFPATLVLNGSTFGSTTYQLGVNIENAPPVLASRGGLTAIQGIPLQVSRIGQFTDPGFGAASASPPRQESFTYSVNWGDGTATDFGNATIESLGAPGAPSRGYFDGLHTYVQTGSYAVTMSVSDDDGGPSQQQFVVSVGVPPRIEISLDRANVSESAGPNSASLKIQIFGFDPAIATTITLTSRDVSEIQLPSSVNIPAGQASVVTSLQAIDDTLLDGTVRVGIVANAGTIASNEVFVDVLDEEQIQLSLNVPSISEHSGAGAATLLVTRSNTDLSQSVVVLLSSNDTSEVQLPPQATIPAGQANVTVGVTAVDDSIWDGSQVVTLSGSSVGYASASVPVTVTDYQPLSLALQSNEILEDDPTRRSTLGNLSIRSPAPSNGLTFQLVADVANQLILPATVFIASGLQTVQFPISAVDDFIPQGRRNVRITASGNGVIASTIDIVIVDTDPAIWTNPNNRLDVNNSGSLEPLDVLAIINEINRRGVRALNPNTDQGIAFVDTNANGQIDPLDALGVINELNRI